MGLIHLRLPKLFTQTFHPENLAHSANTIISKNAAAHRAYHDALATAKTVSVYGAFFMRKRNRKVFKPQPLAYKVKKKEPITAKTDRISHKAYATEEYFYGNGHTYTDKE